MVESRSPKPLVGVRFPPALQYTSLRLVFVFNEKQNKIVAQVSIGFSQGISKLSFIMD